MMVVGIVAAVLALPVLYALYGAFAVQRETTDLSKRRHADAAAAHVAAAVQKRGSSAQPASLWTRLTGITPKR